MFFVVVRVSQVHGHPGRRRHFETSVQEIVAVQDACGRCSRVRQVYTLVGLKPFLAIRTSVLQTRGYVTLFPSRLAPQNVGGVVKGLTYFVRQRHGTLQYTYHSVADTWYISVCCFL